MRDKYHASKYQTDPAYREKRKKQSSVWAKKNRRKISEKANRRKRLANLKQYGIDEDFYAMMLLIQKNGCAICGKTNGKKNLALDHDHLTGKFRGLLCDSCNLGLGLLGDTAESIGRVLHYLTAFDACPCKEKTDARPSRCIVAAD